MENNKLIKAMKMAYKKESSIKKEECKTLKILEDIRKNVQLALDNNKSIPKIKNLYPLLASQDLIYISYMKLLKSEKAYNSGSGQKSVHSFSFEEIKELSKELNTYTFYWGFMKEVESIKKNEQFKRIKLLTYLDKIVQNNILLILESIYEPIFEKYNHNYGFRPNKIGKNCIEKIMRSENRNLNWVITGNLQEAFDNLHSPTLAKILGEIIDDKDFINIIYQACFISQIRKKRIIKESKVRILKSSIISKILFNIYMHKFDMEIEKIINESIKRYENPKLLKNPESEQYKNITYQIEKLSKSYRKFVNLQNIRSLTIGEKEKKQHLKFKIQKLIIKINQTDSINYTKVKFRYFYNRYANDFIILTNQGEKICTFIVEKIVTYLRNNLKLVLSYDKIKSVNLKESKVKYLGYVLFMSNRAKQILVGIDQNMIYQRFVNYKYALESTLEPIHCTTYIKLNSHEIIAKYNSIILGMYNYYYHVITYKSQLNRIWYILYFSALKTLACKHQSTISKIIEIYGCKEYNKSDYSIKKINIVAPIKIQNEIHYISLINRQDLQCRFIKSKKN